MLVPEEIKQRIEKGLSVSHIEVAGDGHHFEACIVSDVFEGKKLLERQRLVYATLGSDIQTGKLHAFSFKTYTPTEWQKLKKSSM